MKKEFTLLINVKIDTGCIVKAARYGVFVFGVIGVSGFWVEGIA